MCESASSHVALEQMRQGDLIFMGEADSSNVSHIALFDQLEKGNVYFIDSTKKDDISGVTCRYYDASDSRFKSFGVMKIQY